MGGNPLTVQSMKIMFFFVSSDRSSCTDDGLLYIYQPTFSDFEHLCLSILLQVSLYVA